MTQLCDLPCGPQAEWRGPGGLTLISWEVNLHAGGAARLSIRSPDGREHLVDGVSLEIAEPERVVFSGRLDIEGLSLHEAHNKVTFRRA